MVINGIYYEEMSVNSSKIIELLKNNKSIHHKLLFQFNLFLDSCIKHAELTRFNSKYWKN